jgi:mazG family protein
LGGVLDKLQEELGKLQAELPRADFSYKADKLNQSQKDKIADELGDVLFVLANLARHLDVDAEMALQNANAKFKRRFAFVEKSLMAQAKTPKGSNLAQMNEYWEMAKTDERH